MVDGIVYYKEIQDNTNFQIICVDTTNNEIFYTKDGKYRDDTGECILFPSKDDKNWNNFSKTCFKPFDKVLVRDSNDDFWLPAFFSFIKDDRYYMIYGSGNWKYCIHYEGNEHLLGTTENILL